MKSIVPSTWSTNHSYSDGDGVNVVSSPIYTSSTFRSCSLVVESVLFLQWGKSTFRGALVLMITKNQRERIQSQVKLVSNGYETHKQNTKH